MFVREPATRLALRRCGSFNGCARRGCCSYKVKHLKQVFDLLKLPTHCVCNHTHHQNDEKAGQLIALRRGQVPSRLRFAGFPDDGMAAFVNLDIEGAAFRWVMGFHAALYREPMPRVARAGIFTPFVKGRRWGGQPLFEVTTPQYHMIVETVRVNRERGNVDTLSCNNRQLTYECVWSQANTHEWFCCFMLDICGWKDLGSTPQLGAREGAGMYVFPLPLPAPAAASIGVSPLSDYRIVHGT